jgi:small conductance mechanosensitive channel
VGPLFELGREYIAPAISVLLGLLVAYFVAKFVSRIVGTPIRKRVDETLGRFVSQMVFYGIMICALLAIAGSVGINITSFAAVLGAAGFAVGLAFQGTLSNFSAGVMLLVFRPFKVGDVISAAGITAKVNEIDLFTTKFDTPDNRRVIVPNSQIAGSTIENITFHQERRVDVSVGTDYAASLDRTREVLQLAAESLSDQMLSGEGRGFQIVLGDLGDSAVGWTVRFWTRAENFWSVKEALTRAVKQNLDEAGIGIPYPQMDIHLHGDESETEGRIKPRLRQ